MAEAETCYEHLIDVHRVKRWLTATSPSGPSASRARSGVQLLRLACALCALEPIICQSQTHLLYVSASDIEFLTRVTYSWCSGCIALPEGFNRGSAIAPFQKYINASPLWLLHFPRSSTYTRRDISTCLSPPSWLLTLKIPLRRNSQRLMSRTNTTTSMST
jgi:hypothetical protein